MNLSILSTIGLIAAVDVIPTNSINSWVEAGSTVVLCALLAWLLTKRMPARDKEHDIAMTAKDKLFADAVKEIADRQHDDSVMLNKTMTDVQVTIAKNQD